jgi:hypothetical protein
MKALLPLLLGAAVLASPAHAAFQAVRIADKTQEIKLDGVLDEAIWKNAPAHDAFFQQQPVDKLPAHVRTEVRLAYDSRYLYIAVTAFDPKPEDIRAPFARRDKPSGDQDFIGIMIDPSGAKKSAQMILVNARGAVTDGVFSDSNGDDYAPDFDFDAVTGRFEGGWTAEVRIPFSSMPYQAGNVQPWSILMMRNLTRDTRYKSYSAPIARSTSCVMCAFEPITGLTDLPATLNWSATPQLVMRKGREDVAGSPRRNFSDHALSLDVKIRPDSATIIDGTINPDFSQIELDAPQLSGNTRFGLFVQEKRPFFLEGSDILQSPLRVISTRSIADPGWGARYTRRDAGSDLTILTAHDAGGGLVLLPKSYNTDFAAQDFGSQATIARGNLKLGKLAVGAIGTDRTLDGGRGYNRVIGPDFSWQQTETTRFRGQLLMSATTAQANAAGVLGAGAKRNGHALFTDWWTEEEKWAGYASIEEVSQGFRADNGFFSQAGYRTYVLEYTKKIGPTGKIGEFNLYSHLERKVDGNGKIIYNDYTPGVFMSGPLDSFINVRVRPFNASRVVENGELHKDRNVWMETGFSPGKVVARVVAQVQFGDQIDVEASRRGKGGNAYLYAKLRPFDQLEFEPTLNALWIDGRTGPEAGKRLYTETALQVNGIYHFGARDTLRMIIQKTKAKRDPALYPFAVAAESTSDTASFVYNHTAGLGTAAYVGLTLTRGETPGYAALRRQNELFVKLSYQI